MSEICIPDTMRNMITIFLTVLLQQWVYVWGQLWHFIIYSQECPSVPLLSLRTNKVRVVGCRQVSLLQFLVAGNKNCFWPTQQTRKPFRVLSSRTRPGYLLASRQQVMVDSSFGAQQLIEDMRLFLLALLCLQQKSQERVQGVKCGSCGSALVGNVKEFWQPHQNSTQWGQRTVP